MHEARMKICRSCEHFDVTTRLCMVCKCFMPAKTRLSWAKCPKNKWV